MDPRYVASSKLLFDQGPDDGGAGTRDYTAAELDAIADFAWPWEGLQRVIATGLQAMTARWTHPGERRDPWSLARSRSPQLSEG